MSLAPGRLAWAKEKLSDAEPSHISRREPGPFPNSVDFESFDAGYFPRFSVGIR
jgi:hypothetical protein